MRKFLFGLLGVVLFVFALGPLLSLLSDIFWWLLTGAKWSSKQYTGAELFATVIWTVVVGGVCAGAFGAIQDGL